MTETLYGRIVDLVNTGIVVLESDGCILAWNEWMEERSGIKAKDIIGLPILEVIPEINSSRISRAIHKALKLNCPSILSAKLLDASFPLYKDIVLGKRNSERIIQSILIKPFMLDNKGQHCVISIYDISSSDLRERALRTQSTNLSNIVNKLHEKDYELKTLFQNTQNGIVIFDNTGRILNANPSAEKVFELTHDELVELHIHELIPELDIRLNPHLSYEQHLQATLPIEGDEVEMGIYNKHNEKLFISVSANIIPYENQATRYFIFLRDVTEKKKVEEKLYRLARFDTLTELFNRTSITEALERAVKSHQRSPQPLTVFFIDLDRFKHINDTLGHAAGDELLQLAAARLKQCCRVSDIIARWAGDEFVLVMEQPNQTRSALTVAEKIIQRFREPFTVRNQTIYVGCSIGIAQFPDDAKDVESLISRADHAMYQAKSEGRGIVRFFTPEMNTRMMEQLRTEQQLRTAIKEQQFLLYFQPQLNLLSGEVVGVEALIRWQHPDKGLVCPNHFIPIAEDCGLISDIGDWVLQHALETAALWHKRDGKALDIAINMSPRQFMDEGLVSKLKKMIDSVGFPASNIVLEITENHLMKEKHSTLVILNALKALGVKIAIDDFGTGYSSLSYLRTLPVDIVKIDREFMINADNDLTGAHIVSAIIDLAHALKLEVVAEGIELVSQLELLKTKGCDHAQGYFVGKPMDPETFRKWQSRTAKDLSELRWTH